MDFDSNIINGFDRNLEIWPVEHPVEPREEDRPVKCPKIPHTSAMNDENSYDEGESYEILRRKAKFVAVIDGKEELGRKTPRRVMRKRPHNHTQMADDSTNTPTISPLFPFPPSHNNYKFQ